MIVGHRDVRRKIGMQGRKLSKAECLFPTDLSAHRCFPRPYQE